MSESMILVVAREVLNGSYAFVNKVGLKTFVIGNCLYQRFLNEPETITEFVTVQAFINQLVCAKHYRNLSTKQQLIDSKVLVPNELVN
jgi:hypothetical protein